MAQKRLTINLPRSADALHNALQMLLQYNKTMVEREEWQGGDFIDEY